MGMTGTFKPDTAVEGRAEQLFKFSSIRGYIISTCFIPDQGYQGHFYVYIFDSHEADTKFDETMYTGDAASKGVIRGTLEISGETRNYKFEKIDFTYAETGATRRERFRILEFRYNRNLTDREAVPATIGTVSTEKLTQGGLGTDYTFILDDSSETEHLLGFSARLASEDSAVVRFSKLRNQWNSTTEKVLKLNNDRVSVLGAERAMTPFKLTFGFRNDPITVDRDNLLRVFTHEAYGLGMPLGIPSLSGLITAGAGPEKARLAPEAYTPLQLLLHESEQEQAVSAATRSVETTTFVFQKGHLRDLPVV